MPVYDTRLLDILCTTQVQSCRMNRSNWTLRFPRRSDECFARHWTDQLRIQRIASAPVTVPLGQRVIETIARSLGYIYCAGARRKHGTDTLQASRQ